MLKSVCVLELISLAAAAAAEKRVKSCGLKHDLHLVALYDI